MSEYLSKKAVLEWLKRQQKRQEEKRDRLEIDHPYWEYHNGASDYLSLAVEEFESGAFDADNTEIHRLRAALEMAQSELRWGDPINAIERVERIIDEALSTATEPTAERPDESQVYDQHSQDLGETEKIKQWAKDRGLDTADPAKQMLKLGEEYGELCQGMAKGNQEQIIDSIGDIYVVLTVLSLQLGLDINDCINQAYEEIKDRKGRMINGVFVKNADIVG